MQKKLHIKKGDTVKVLSGESKGSEGKVLSVDRKKMRAVVEGVNIVKKHKKPDAKNPNGGRIDEAAGLHISNLILVVNGQATRTGKKEEKGKMVRFAKKTGEVIK